MKKGNIIRMHPYILDESLLEDFKQVINDHDDFLINAYGDINGKNLWNLMCSSKDWLHVSVYGLPYIQLNHENMDVRSLNVLQLIMTYDLVVQAIEQLLRIFEIEYPYKEDHSVFNESVPDDTYFTQIRACFAAHPVNLNSSDGQKNVKSDERYFASWSSDVGGCGDYTVHLYSNKPGVSPIPFTLSFVRIHQYIVIRYSLLSMVMNEIEKKREQFIQKHRQIIIRRSPDTVEQLQILLEENNIRICEDYGYQYEIKTLIELFTAPQEFRKQERDIVASYMSSLNLLIEDIYESLQSMIFDDLAHGYLINSRSHRYKELFYDISKVFEYLNNPYYSSSLLDYHLNRLIEGGVFPSYVNQKIDRLDLKLLLLSGLAIEY